MTLIQTSATDFANFLKNTDPSEFKNLIKPKETSSYVPFIDSFLETQDEELMASKFLIERFFTFLSTLLLIDSLSKQKNIDDELISDPLLTKHLFDKIQSLRNHYVHNLSLY